MVTNLPDIPPIVREELLQWLGAEPLELARSGLSGAIVIRCRAACGDFCLRGWPVGTSEEKLRQVYSAISTARVAGVDVVPAYMVRRADSTPWVAAAGRFWELTEWMPGRADYLEHPDVDRLQDVCLRLGTLHRLWRRQTHRIPLPSPGVQRRLQLLARKLEELSADCHDPWYLVPEYAPASSTIRQLWRQTMEHTRRCGPELLQELNRIATVPVEQHFVIRDLHSEHVLFIDKRVTGIIDFGASGIDEPLMDLVRLLSTMEPFGNHWEVALAVYESTAELQIDRRRLQAIDAVSCLLSAWQWCQWLVVEGRQFSQPLPTLLERWRRQLARLPILPSVA
ncbi:MAG: hypothetical protein KatS3mg111_0034 [Pirellulaceae bacterium]|nr:MAG: hypothetical protein KatS3mg111_0034 [Pirellulaceae bacterium]